MPHQGAGSGNTRHRLDPEKLRGDIADVEYVRTLAKDLADHASVKDADDLARRVMEAIRARPELATVLPDLFAEFIHTVDGHVVQDAYRIVVDDIERNVDDIVTPDFLEGREEDDLLDVERPSEADKARWAEEKGEERRRFREQLIEAVASNRTWATDLVTPDFVEGRPGHTPPTPSSSPTLEDAVGTTGTADIGRSNPLTDFFRYLRQTGPDGNEPNRSGAPKSTDTDAEGRRLRSAQEHDAVRARSLAARKVELAREKWLDNVRRSYGLDRPNGPVNLLDDGRLAPGVTTGPDGFSATPVEFIGFGGTTIPFSDNIRADDITVDDVGGRRSSVDAMARRAEGLGVSVGDDGSLSPGSQVLRGIPRYVPGDERAPIRHLGPDEIAQLQRRLALSGLLSPDAVVRRGTWGPAEQAAFREVLAYANQSGSTWNRALSELVADEENAISAAILDARDSFQPDLSQVTRPDNATLRQRFRDILAQELGRLPSDHEMREFMADQAAYFDQMLESEVDRQRAEWEAQSTAVTAQGVMADRVPAVLRTDADREALADIDQAAAAAKGPRQDFDFAARAREFADRELRGEMDLRDDAQNVRENQARNTQIMGSIAQRLLGGVR